MDIRDSKFYDLIANGFADMSYQEFVDSFLADTQNQLNTPGFSFDPDMQMDFTFAQVEAELGLATMATYVDAYSPASYKSTEGFTIQTGQIPRMKHGYALNEKILREEMIIAQRTGRFSTSLAQRMQDLMFDHSEKLILGNYNSLTYQRHQMVSNGQFVLNATNNPAGIKSVTFSAKIPPANVTTLTSTAKWFTDSANTEGSTSNPIKNLKDIQNKLEDDGVEAYHWEVDKRSLERAFNHSDIKAAVGLKLYPLVDQANLAGIIANMGVDAMKVALEGVLGCPITVVNSIVAVEKFDSATGKVSKSQMRSFAADTWVLVPDGSLGSIKTVEPIVVSDPAARVATFDGGRTLLKQWYDIKTNTQYVESEHTSLVVIDKPKYIYRLVTA